MRLAFFAYATIQVGKIWIVAARGERTAITVACLSCLAISSPILLSGVAMSNGQVANVAPTTEPELSNLTTGQ